MTLSKNEIIDYILTETSYRLSPENIDFSNKNHIYELSEVMNELQIPYELKQGLIRNLLKEDDTKQFQNPILNKVVTYKDKDGNEKEGMVGNLLTSPKDSPGRIEAEKLLPKKGTPERDAINQEIGSQGGGGTQDGQQGGEQSTDDEIEQSKKKFALDPSVQKQVEKEKETRDKIEKEKSGDTEEDIQPVKQENILNKEKNKTLKPEINKEYYDKDINPSDDEYEKTKPAQNSDSPVRLPDGIFGTPSKVPKKYQKLMERLINARYINDTTPPMTSMVDGSGAGKIQAQAGEVMSMVFTSLDDKEFEELVNTIRTHNSKNEIKKNDGSSYSPPRYSKENQPVLTEDWIKSAISVRAGIRERYNAEYGKGNWEVENGAWDLKDEVEAMGLEDYPNNKGFSTDMYLRVKNKKTGESILDEVSLKKDLNIFLSQPSVSAVDTWAFTKEESDEFERLSNRRAEIKTKIDSKTASPAEKKEDKDLIKKQKQLLENGNSRVPKPANPKAFNDKMRLSATNYYNDLSLQQLTLLNSVDDSKEGIQKLAKELNQDVGYTKQFVKVLKTLTHPVSRDELKKQMKDGGFPPSKTAQKYLDKFSVMTMRTAKMMGDEDSAKKLEDHLKMGKDFNKAFVENMVKEPFKSGMMNTVREKFPLKALLEGEEKMSLGGVVADPVILETIFGTTDYNKIEENLTIDGPDENGEYQLVFEVEASGKKIPLSTVAPRQRGLGYEPTVQLEMNLHGAMKENLYCANVKAGRNFPEKEELSTKYNCDSF